MLYYLMMSTGFLLAADDQGRFGMTGTCACYRHWDVVVTAAHGVPETARDPRVVLPGDPAPRLAVEIICHPANDLAVVVAERRKPE